MRITLVLLCTLLFIWMGGSSYFYVCIINDNCSTKNATTTEVEVQPETPEIEVQNQKVDELEENESGEDLEEVSDEESDQVNEESVEVSETPQIVDSVSMAGDYIEKNPSRAIYFNYAKYDKGLSEEDIEYIKMLRLYIENEPGKEVFLTGHSDSIGSPEGRMFASYQRVVFMKGALVKAGIPVSVVSTKSMGDSIPEGSNSTVEGRAKNRRVEISIRNL